MGCHICKAQNKNWGLDEHSPILQNRLWTHYSQAREISCGLGTIYHKFYYQCITLRISNNYFQLFLKCILEDENTNLFHSKFRVNCNQETFVNQTYKFNEVFSRNEYETIFKIKCKQIYYADGIISIRQNQKQQNLILIHNRGKLRIFLWSYKRKKLIFKFKEMKVLQLFYDQVKKIAIVFQRFDENSTIDIINIQNRSKVVSQNFEDVRSLRTIQNHDDLLLNIKDQGLVLYKINYINQKIERIKILNLSGQIQAFVVDEDNQLHTFSKDIYIQFDKDYNIIKKFNINFQNLANVQKRWRNDLRQISDFCINRRCYEFSFQQRKEQYYEETTNQQCITEFCNYQIEYIHQAGSIQHIISSNQRYLTFKIEQNLIFYKIQENQEQQMLHQKKIHFLNFSANSNYLYVVLEDRVCCYKANQGLKLYYKLHLLTNHLSSSQNGILMSINDRGQVRTISKQCKKQIFKLNTIQTKYISFEYQTKDGMILVSSQTEISLFSLIDRKPIMNLQKSNLQCKIIQNTDYLFILTEEECVELWSFEQNNIKFCRDIMSNIQAILQGYSNNQCLKNREYIFTLDQNFNFIKQIDYQCEYTEDNFIDNYSQIIQENYILIVNVNQAYRSKLVKILISLFLRGKHQN